MRGVFYSSLFLNKSRSGRVDEKLEKEQLLKIGKVFRFSYRGLINGVNNFFNIKDDPFSFSDNTIPVERYNYEPIFKNEMIDFNELLW